MRREKSSQAPTRSLAGWRRRLAAAQAAPTTIAAATAFSRSARAQSGVAWPRCGAATGRTSSPPRLPPGQEQMTARTSPPSCVWSEQDILDKISAPAPQPAAAPRSPSPLPSPAQAAPRCADLRNGPAAGGMPMLAQRVALKSSKQGIRKQQAGRCGQWSARASVGASSQIVCRQIARPSKLKLWRSLTNRPHA